MAARSMGESNLLFVYGSLLRGEVNFPVLARAGARFVGLASTLRPFPLEQGPRWRRLYDWPGAGLCVKGELFVMDRAEAWDALDAFEGHPHGYRRRLERVVAAGGRQGWAWIYFFHAEGADPRL